jgi:hypothetical protein
VLLRLGLYSSTHSPQLDKGKTYSVPLFFALALLSNDVHCIKVLPPHPVSELQQQRLIAGSAHLDLSESPVFYETAFASLNAIPDSASNWKETAIRVLNRARANRFCNLIVPASLALSRDELLQAVPEPPRPGARLLAPVMTRESRRLTHCEKQYLSNAIAQKWRFFEALPALQQRPKGVSAPRPGPAKLRLLGASAMPLRTPGE